MNLQLPPRNKAVINHLDVLRRAVPIQSQAHAKYNRMMASFLNKTEYMASAALENYRTMTTEWYTTIFLPLVIDEICKKDP